MDYISEKVKESLRKINKESAAYAGIGLRCFFCNGKITEKDTVFPNHTMTSEKGHHVHGDCYDYVIKKYPNVPISELERKIVRVKRW